MVNLTDWATTESYNNNNDSCSTMWIETTTTFRIILYVAGIPLLLAIAVVNIMGIAVVAKNPKLQIKAVNVILSWTIADLVMAAMLLSRIILYPYLWNYVDHPFLCNLWNVTFLFPLVTCFSHVMILAACRFVAVTARVYYEDHLSSRKLRGFITLCWVYSAVLSCTALLWTRDVDSADDKLPCSMFLIPKGLGLLLLTVHFVPCLCVAAALFSRVFMVVSRHKRQIHVTTTISEQKLDEDVELARTFLCTCALYVTCWAPYLIVQIVWFVSGPSQAVQILTLCTLYVGILSSALKPFVWAYRHAHIRDAAVKLVQKDKHVHIVVTRACSSC